MNLRKRKCDPNSSVVDSVAKNKKVEWHIEDYLLDSEWKRVLSDEFVKDYFVSLNKILEKGFAKKIFRPQESLVFNAFNSTPFSQVRCSF